MPHPNPGNTRGNGHYRRIVNSQSRLNLGTRIVEQRCNTQTGDEPEGREERESENVKHESLPGHDIVVTPTA
jgi:hypothetical protein